MRRRRGADITSAVDVVALWLSTRDEARALFNDAGMARAYVAAVLAERGTDAVEAVRARRWLRRGSLPGEGWRS